MSDELRDAAKLLAKWADAAADFIGYLGERADARQKAVAEAAEVLAKYVLATANPDATAELARLRAEIASHAEVVANVRATFAATGADNARLRTENERLRAALQRELARLQSIGRNQTHYEGCDGSQGHAICYAIRLIREALNPPSSTPAPVAATELPPSPPAPTEPSVS